MHNWPRVISAAWQLCEVSVDKIDVIHREYFIVKPEGGFEWNAESQKIHGISYERAEQEGVPIQTIMALLKEHGSQASVVVSHNIAFDKPIVLAECVRLGLPIDWWPKIEYCTMDATKGICKLPSRSKYPSKSDPYKYPKLSELHTYLFGNLDGFEFHSASEDVRCLVKCFADLVFRRVVPLDLWLSA